MTNTTKTAIILTLVLGWQASAMAQVAVDPIRLDRALANYRALRDGSKQIGDLTHRDLIDVDAIDRQIRDQNRDPRSLSQRCVDDELRREGGSVSALTRRVIDMKCREAGD
jgi:hypothetical protein